MVQNVLHFANTTLQRQLLSLDNSWKHTCNNSLILYETIVETNCIKQALNASIVKPSPSDKCFQQSLIKLTN